ncbi:threonine synthase [Candidatus Peregrinibacteria bacterium]|nr:MAG: threonine synthase [Candidatus Peregrinibacteria bacterium]
MKKEFEQSCGYHIQCVSCGKRWKEEETITNCLDCGNALEVVMNLEKIALQVNRFALTHTPLSAAKYLDFYPICDRSKVVTLSEGNTPLYRAERLGKSLGFSQLFIKDEGANPTGVFKDRGSLVEITKALEMGATAICVASTGNMAASVSAYASRAGLPCYVLVPEGTPIGKLAQTLSYGGKLIQIRGTYADCVRLSDELSRKNNFYLAGDYAFRAEGAKSTAFEILEQLHWKVPDAVLVPVGCGTNLAGIAKGFREFFELGYVNTIPRMIAVQPEGCNTVCEAFHSGADRFTPVDKPKTVASAVGIGFPLDDIKCLCALKQSGGTAETASDEDILLAQYQLSKQESVFTEPSGAIPIAVLPKLLEKGLLKADEIVVCIATGTGLKDPKAAIQSFAEPSTISAQIEDIERFLQSGASDMRPSRQSQKEEEVFQALPSGMELRIFLEKEFSHSPDDIVLENVLQEIDSFFRRGKTITKADLLNMLEEAIENTNIPEFPLSITDFSVEDSFQKSPFAQVLLDFSGDSCSGQSIGVGPVDALIKAMKNALSSVSDFWPELADFHVEIITSKESAIAKVFMAMQDGEGNQVHAKASSPDVIVAALHAFIKGFNLLFDHRKK